MMMPSGSTRAPCGDLLERQGDVLVIRATLPIEELVPSRYRAPVLLVSAERFVLEGMHGAAPRPVYRLRRADAANAFEAEGKVLTYDGERHIERRRDRTRAVLGWLLLVPTVPLMPIIGLLPERWKARIAHLGLDPMLAGRLSLFLQTLFVVMCLIMYFVLGAFFTLPGIVMGLLAIFAAVDVAYRVSAHQVGRAPGAFGLAPALAAFVKKIIVGRDDE